MPRPLLFCDLAGTLEVRDPRSSRLIPWPGVRTVLDDLARDHDLHLATGDSRPGAVAALRELDLSHLFSSVHAELPAGGKPFAALAALARRPAHLCLALGDDPMADTARDSDEVVSVVVRHGRELVRPTRVAAAIRALGGAGSFRAGLAVAVAAAAESDQPGSSPGQPAPWDDLPRSDLAGGCRLGWWHKPGQGPRPVVTFGW